MYISIAPSGQSCKGRAYFIPHGSVLDFPTNFALVCIVYSVDIFGLVKTNYRLSQIQHKSADIQYHSPLFSHTGKISISKTIIYYQKSYCKNNANCYYYILHECIFNTVHMKM